MNKSVNHSDLPTNSVYPTAKQVPDITKRVFPGICCLYTCHIRRINYPGKQYRPRIRSLQQQMLLRALQDAKDEAGRVSSQHSLDNVPDNTITLPLTIARGPHGKPYLPDYPDFHYNFTDSGDWLILAVSETGNDIGIDLQKEVPVKAGILPMARRFFHPDDTALLESSESEASRTHLFFRIWTVKEASLKYTGEGLSGGMHRHPVDFAAHKIGGVPFLELPPPSDEYFLTICY